MLRQISHGMMNLNTELRDMRTNSEHRWAATDAKIDRNQEILLEKLTSVSDRGGRDYENFRDAIHALNVRLTAQEQRRQGQFDVLKPLAAWATKNWPVVILALAVCWNEYVRPALANNAHNNIQIESAL